MAGQMKKDREKLMMEIAVLRARGRRPGEIAREKGITVTTVYNYLNRVDENYDSRRTETAVEAHREAIAEELREVEAEAWKAWEGSKTRMEFDADGNTLTIPDNPDPRYLGVVVQCVADRRKLYGLDVPVVKEVNHTGQFDFRAFFAAVPDEIPDTVTADIYTLPPPLNEVASNDPLQNPLNSTGSEHLNGKNGKH